MLHPEFQSRVQWREWLPWLVLLRTWELSLRGRALATALIAALLLRLLTSLLGAEPPLKVVMITPVGEMSMESRVAWEQSLRRVASPWGPILSMVDLTRESLFNATRLLSPPFSARSVNALVVGVLTVCLYGLWGLFGGAIARAAVLSLREAPVTWPVLMRYSLSHAISALGGPLLPMAVVVLMAMFLWVLGLPVIIPALGQAYGVVVSPIIVAVSLLAAILLVVILVAWPLVFAAAHVDGVDAFNALSRCYNYVTARPWHLLWYLLVLVASAPIAMMINSLVLKFAEVFSLWAVLRFGPPGMASSAIRWLCSWLSDGATISFCWTAVGLVFVLLRRSVDGIPVDEYAPEILRAPEPYPVAGMAATPAEPKDETGSAG